MDNIFSRIEELSRKAERLDSELDVLADAITPPEAGVLATIPALSADLIRGKLEAQLRKWKIAALVCGGVALALAGVLFYVCICI